MTPNSNVSILGQNHESYANNFHSSPAFIQSAISAVPFSEAPTTPSLYETVNYVMFPQSRIIQ